jgi:uncharacterized protein (DUF1810 family)
VNDPYDLQRFVDAQRPHFAQVFEELRRGYKEGHWMWFIFPQIKGLGRSSMAERYAISSRAETQAYLVHPVLGPRLRQCAALVNALQSLSALEIFGPIDSMKYRSSMTLFAYAAEDNRVFMESIAKFWGGEFDHQTVSMLGGCDDRPGKPLGKH